MRIEHAPSNRSRRRDQETHSLNSLGNMQGAEPAVVSRFEVVGSETDIRHPDLRGLYAYWRSKHQDGRPPSRADIDPIDMRAWLSHLILTDIDAESADVRFRVIGTWMVDRIGRDDTGMSMREIGLNPSRQTILDSYLQVASTLRPHVSEGLFFDRYRIQRHIRTERILLPLSRDGETCDMVLAAIYFRDPKDEHPCPS